MAPNHQAPLRVLFDKYAFEAFERAPPDADGLSFAKKRPGFSRIATRFVSDCQNNTYKGSPETNNAIPRDRGSRGKFPATVIPYIDTKALVVRQRTARASRDGGAAPLTRSSDLLPPNPAQDCASETHQ